MGFDETGELAFQLWAVLANRPGKLGVVMHNNALVNLHIGVQRRPDFCDISIHHRGLEQPGIDHLQQVFGFQVFIGGLQVDGRQALLLE
ncbi:hypothetical protein D3C87_1992100 [compost metagenome]